MRVTSEFWVAAYVRRCFVEGATAVLGRRGAREAGAIFVVVDHLDGQVDLFGPAPQILAADGNDGGRTFECLIAQGSGLDVRDRIARELKFDVDLWVVEVEDRAGRHFLDLAG